MLYMCSLGSVAKDLVGGPGSDVGALERLLSVICGAGRAQEAASRADLPALRGALAARQPTHRRPRRRRAVHSLLTRPFWPLAGSSPQRYLPIQMGSPRFALLLLLLPRAGTPLSLKNT